MCRYIAHETMDEIIYAGQLIYGAGSGINMAFQ